MRLKPYRHYVYTPSRLSHVLPSHFISFHIPQNLSEYKREKRKSNEKKRLKYRSCRSRLLVSSIFRSPPMWLSNLACRNVPCVPPCGPSSHPLIWRGPWKTGREHAKGTLDGPRLRNRTSIADWGSLRCLADNFIRRTCMDCVFIFIFCFLRLHRQESRPGGWKGFSLFFPSLPYLTFFLSEFLCETSKGLGHFFHFYFYFL